MASPMSPELELSIAAAREAGKLLRENYELEPVVDELRDHDIKLALDIRSQELITDMILDRFPDHAIYGEEGVGGNQESPSQWIIDPIDGTVNYYYGIPHFCISIALKEADELKLGVIYDPMLDEAFAVDYEGPVTRNGIPVQPSSRSELKDAVVTIGFSKTRESLDAGLERYRQYAHKVRKTRMLGSAALALAYVTCGRLDAYIEEQIRIWDIAAGQVMLERVGGAVMLEVSVSDPDKSRIVAHNGKLPLQLS